MDEKNRLVGRNVYFDQINSNNDSKIISMGEQCCGERFWFSQDNFHYEIFKTSEKIYKQSMKRDFTGSFDEFVMNDYKVVGILHQLEEQWRI